MRDLQEMVMWLDFGGDPDHEADAGIFKENFPIGDRANCANYTDV